ncbi:PIG-L deacetylase family protein [Aquipuribacter sp. SD81]|uniref:PIG-L deacetylase family protein n=1 Tax=Aquipuribacter sp. SD81 TaxID=3127703 RepID=UPI0030199FFF
MSQVIAGAGTPETHWRPWLAGLAAPTAVPPATPPGRAPRVLVLVAHPDDEVLGAGGLLHGLARRGWRVDVVWATDGEASHPGSTVVSGAELARRRREESVQARDVLGLDGTTTWLALPDSGLLGREADVAAAADRALQDGGVDLVLAPWREDGHPDHEVCGRAAARAAARHGVPLWEVPIWAWHWGTADVLAPRWSHAHLVALDEATRTVKAAAVAQFVTQVRPLGPAAADRAVLPPEVLARFARDVELVLVTPAVPS